MYTTNYVSRRFSQQRGFIVNSINDKTNGNSWNAKSNETAATNDKSYFDAAVLVIEDFDDEWENKIKLLQESVIPGGYFLLFLISSEVEPNIEMYGFNYNIWDIDNLHDVYEEEEELLVYCIQKRPSLVNVSACTWKYSLASSNTTLCLKHEYDVLSDVTITSPANEYKIPTYKLSSQSITSAVNALQTHGFCIVKNILPREIIHSFAQASIQDMKEAIHILKSEHDIDVLDPISSTNQSISNFREMAMREDLRVDLRDGKELRKMIELHGQDWIKKNESILEILTKVMNPRDDEKRLHEGNFGKWNFENAALGGPNAPPEKPKSGKIGTILTFPKCGDQAIHADTFHLFDVIDCHPPHYINLFLPTSSSKNGFSNPMGGTAFISKSHILSTCKSYLEHKKEMYYNIVRPSLEIGDAILFDCRVLHFGMANTSQVESDCTDGWRPMVYVNWMVKWFSDPKNWDNEKRLFVDLDE